MNPAKLLMVDLPGPVLEPHTKAHLQKFGFGAVCLFRRNIQTLEQTSQLVADLREVLGNNIFVAVDQEGGMVARVLEIPQAPAPLALAAAGGPELAWKVGNAVGRGLKSLGINWNFAPVLDVNTNPQNPIIGERSFGSSPQSSSLLALSWLSGLEQAGVMGAGKHFPGHGDTHQDSHHTLPVVSKNRAELEQTEFFPFRQAIKQGIRALMTAHIVFEALDPHHPATLSKTILTNLLRQEWGFSGLIITDAMDMKAIAERYGAGEAALAAILAGADMVCAIGSEAKQAEQALTLQQALDSGVLSQERLWQSLERLAQAQQDFAGFATPYKTSEQQADQTLMEQAALASITAYGPVQKPRTTDRLVLIAPQSARVGMVYEEESTSEKLLRHLKTQFGEVKMLTYPADQPLAVWPQIESTSADFWLHATTSRTTLHPQELELSQRLFALGQPALHLALWNPYHVQVLQKPALLSYGFREPSLKGLVQVLAGAPAQGRLPI